MAEFEYLHTPCHPSLSHSLQWRHLKRVMRSIPPKEAVEQQPLSGVLDVIPVHPPLTKPGCLRVLLCSTSLYATLPEEAVAPIKEVAHALVEVQVPRESPMKKQEIFLESKWVWPQNSLASGPPPPEVPSAEESQMILRCMRQTWAVAVAAHRAGVNPSLSACLIHDPFMDRVLAADVSAAHPRIPRTSTAGILMASDSAFPSHHRGMTFAATLATPPSAMGEGPLASAGSAQERTGGPPDVPGAAARSSSMATQADMGAYPNVASADLPILASSCLRSRNITQQLPTLCRQLGLEAAGDEECQRYMDAAPSVVGGVKRPPPSTPPPLTVLLGAKPSPPFQPPTAPSTSWTGSVRGVTALTGPPPRLSPPPVSFDGWLTVQLWGGWRTQAPPLSHSCLTQMYTWQLSVVTCLHRASPFLFRPCTLPSCAAWGRWRLRTRCGMNAGTRRSSTAWRS